MTELPDHYYKQLSRLSGYDALEYSTFKMYRSRASESLRHACSENDTAYIQQHILAKRKIPENVLTCACKYGYIDVCKLVSVALGLTKLRVLKMCYLLAVHGHVNLLEWLNSKTGFMPPDILLYASTLKMLKFLCINYKHDDLYFSKAFEMICCQGDLVMAKWLYDNYDFTVSPRILENVSKGGHIELIKRLVLTGKVYVRFKKSLPFRNACKHGHLELAKYYYSLEPTCVGSKLNDIYKTIYRKNYIDVIKWIHEIFPDEKPRQEEFNAACKKGQLELAQHLHSIGHINPRRLLPADISCVEMAKWLFSLDVPYFTEQMELYKDWYIEKGFTYDIMQPVSFTKKAI